MKNTYKKTLVFLLLLIATISIVSCDQATTVTTTNENITTTTLVTTQSTVTTESIDYSRLEITNPDQLIYDVNESLDLTGLVVTYYSNNNVPFIIQEGSYTFSEVDMSTPGVKTVNVSFNGYTDSFTIEVFLNDDDLAYYSNVDTSSSSALRISLHTILSTTIKGISYGDARDILQETDQDPNNSSNIILVYLGESVSRNWDPQGPNIYNWNREHVWPKSYLPDKSVNNGSISSASDLHNLKPSNTQENSNRSALYFSAYSGGYEPRDEVKGDIARIMFYMAIMYELTLVNGTPAYLEMGQLSELLAWHELDPVDDFERNRNEVIFSYQENRNPFIDHPEWVDIIW